MAMESLYQAGFGGTKVTDVGKILAELQNLTISGPITGGSANTALTVSPTITTKDTVIKVLGVTTSSGVWEDLTSSTTVVSDYATGTLTLSGVVANDTVQVNGKTLTFATFSKSIASSPAPMTVPVGATDTISATNLAHEINASVAGVTASASGAVVTVTAVATGTAGNSIGLVGDSHVTASGSTLAGGSTASSIKISADTTGQQVFVHWFKKA